jgi:DNA invertase Pin-like site-specific DNA recombinase
MKKLIKNYTTDVPVEKTIAEIQKILAQNGARGIMLEYDERGTVKDIFFRIIVNNTELPFRLPAKAERVYQALWGEKQEGERRRYGRDGDSKRNALRGVSVRHGLRHRSPLSIWNRQKWKRPFYPIWLCRGTRHCLKQWNKISFYYQVSTIRNENSLRHYRMLIGYARVSKNEQNLDLQRDALLKAGCREQDIFTDKITGTKQERNGLTQALTHLREGDTFVVWRLDRLGRSLKHLIETVTKLHEQKIAFQSITEHIDTATATGQLVFHIFGALAEFERNLIRERTIAGLESARARGRLGGRPELNASAAKVAMAKKLYADKTNSVSDICKTLNISRATLYRYIKA